MPQASKDAEGLSIKFALKMVQMADRPGLIWLKHIVAPYADDCPATLDGRPGMYRHLTVQVERQDCFGIVAECRVHKTECGWTHGSVRVGHLDETGEICKYDPEKHFEYDRQQGMIHVRKVPVELSRVTADVYKARALEADPDVTPSLREWGDEKLPHAGGVSEFEALGRLVYANQDLFRMEIRRFGFDREDDTKPLQRISTTQMCVLEDLIRSEKKVHLFSKKAAIWMLRQSNNLTRPFLVVFCNTQYATAEDIAKGIHDMVSSCRATRLQDAIQRTGSPMVLSSIMGSKTDAPQSPTRPSLAWLSTCGLLDRSLNRLQPDYEAINAVEL